MNQTCADSVERCRAYYEAKFQQFHENKEEAIEQTLHLFLNGNPSTSASIRIAGITLANFWNQVAVFPNTSTMKFAVSQIIRGNESVALSFLEQFSIQNSSFIKAAIRYSRLFEDVDSVVYLFLKSRLKGNDWVAFFSYCDQLVIKLTKLQNQLAIFEKRLNFLTPFEYMFYLNVVIWLRWSHCVNTDSDFDADFSQICDVLIGNKLKSSKSGDLELTESKIGQSMKSHFMPLLVPMVAASSAVVQANKTLLSMTHILASAVLVEEHSSDIDKFCVDFTSDFEHEVYLQFTSSVFLEEHWLATGKKLIQLSNYWHARGMDALLDSGINLLTICKEDQQDAVWTALTKVYSSLLQLDTLYGIVPTAKISDDKSCTLFQLLQFVELHRQFFVGEHVEPLTRMLKSGIDPLEALGRLMLDGLLSLENRAPIDWSTVDEKVAKTQKWLVSDKWPNGDAKSAREIINFWSVDANELKNGNISSKKLLPRLHEKQLLRFGPYVLQFPWLGADNHNTNAIINSFRRLGNQRPELKNETHTAELDLAVKLRTLGFKVVQGYHQPIVSEDDVGEIDVLCALDDIVIMIEMKTSYVRGSRREIWLHGNTTLRKAGWQLKRKSKAFSEMLRLDPTLRESLGIHQSPKHVHTWIVDTCIEYDGQTIDGSLVVSRDVLEIVMRDELHLLNPVGGELKYYETPLFSDGVSASRFIEVIENQYIWRDLSALHSFYAEIASQFQ